MSATDDAQTGTLQDALRRVTAARQQGDLAAARQHLETARWRFPDTTGPQFPLFEAGLLQDAGETEQAGRAFERILETHPDNQTALQALIRLSRQQGDIDAALGYLERALPQDPGGTNVMLQMLHADVLLDAGRTDQAIAVLEALSKARPDALPALQRLSHLAHQSGDLRAALGHSKALLARAGDTAALGLYLHHARLLEDAQDTEAALAFLGDLQTRHGPVPQITLQQVRIHAMAGRRDQAEDCLAEALAIQPLDAQLLRHLYTFYIRTAPLDVVNRVTGLLRPRLPAELADELETEVFLKTMQPAAALQRLRRRRCPARTEPQARKLARALLFGARTHATGLRYTRFCLRRWPSSQVLLGAYVEGARRVGRYADIVAHLDRLTGTIPDDVILSHRFTHYAYTGDLENAVACYERLQALGKVSRGHRGSLITLIFTTLDPAAADALFDRIGHPMAEEIGPHDRASLKGQQMLEFELEHKALSDSGIAATPADWVRAHPQSTVPAVRLVNKWYTDAVPAQGPDAAEIPRQIVQYWDAPRVPDDLAPLIESWAAAPGFEHRLFDRAGAARFLRENMGPKWVTAFRMAHNSTKESDFLRLCYLAHSGGVYADADDLLTGDLARLLGRAQGRGLLLFRDPLGGALANNFIAAPARHPVIVQAARLARASLLRRGNEQIWSATGPGLLTRAFAQYLAQTDAGIARRQVTLLDWPEVTAEILMHNPVAYKVSTSYWQSGRPVANRVWERLETALLAPAPVP